MHMKSQNEYFVQCKAVLLYDKHFNLSLWKTRWKVWKSTRYSGESKAFHKVSAIYGKAIYFTHSFLRHVACGSAKKQRKMDWKRHFGIYNKRRVFSDKTKGPPKRAFKSTEYLKVMPQPFLFYCGGRESLRRRSQRKRGIRRPLRHRTLCRRWCQTERRRAGCRECRRFAPRK